MIRTVGLTLGVVLMTFVSASAHQGVRNPAVKARMDAMVGINDAMQTIAHMAKGGSPFNQSEAKSAVAEIARLAGVMPDLFRDRQDDPKSEALSVIWDDFDDFVQKSMDMQHAAFNASGLISDAESLTLVIREIGVTCKACHSDYRK